MTFFASDDTINKEKLRRNIVKKRLLCFVFTLLFLTSATSCGTVSDTAATSETTSLSTAEPNINDAADDMVVGSINGTVLYIDDNKITIDADGEQISFALNSKTTIKGDISSNKPAAVYFMGNISKTDQLTVAEIITGDIGSDGADAVMDDDKPDSVYAVVSGRADEILAGMSLEEKVGQMFMISCNGRDDLDTLISDYHIGGLVMLPADFEYENKATFRQKIDSLQGKSTAGLFIAVEEEGGTVNTISRFSQFRAVPFWSSKDLYNEGGFSYIETIAIEKASLLNNLGININFDPMCSVVENENSVFYSRSFGQTVQLTADYVSTTVSTFKEHNVASALKYFPGYDGNGDESGALIFDSRSYDEFDESDFIPFRTGIRKGAEFIIISHNIVPSMDSENPASLSAPIHEILRSELGFAGIVITDDMNSEALLDYADSRANVAVLAVAAGNDMIYTDSCTEEIAAVIDAVNSGAISEEQIDISVLRILNAKIKLGIIE